MSKLIGFAFVLAIDVPLVILRGLVLASLWLWFFVPFGLPEIGIAHAIGVSLLVSLLTKQRVPNDERDFWEAAVGAILGNLLTSLVAWGMGAIVHGFM